MLLNVLKRLIIFLIITLTATIFSLSEVYGEPIIFDDDYLVEIFVGGLHYPTTMDFVGDDILVLEKNTGKVIRIMNNGIMYNEPVLDVPVRSNFYSGLLGIATLSDRVFLYYTESESGSDAYDPGPDAKNRVYQYDWDGEKLTNPILIKELIAQQRDDHHGGVMTKGQNDEIYFAIGDQNQSGIFENVVENPCYIIHFVNDKCSSEPIYETASIFKIHTNDDNRVELFAMGIRNSFGLGVDPVTGYLWDTENGKDHFDEINLVKPRFNSGWNSVMGPVDRDNPDPSVSQTIPPPFENFVYSDPEFSWYEPVGPTAIAFPDLTSFGKYSDMLFVGDYHHGRIYNFQLNSDRTEFVFSDQRLSDLVLDKLNDKVEKILFAEGFRTVTDIEFRHDAMYVVSIAGGSAGGSIYKIYPKDPITPLKQYQAGSTHKKIVCKPGLIPIMKNSGYINCANLETALILTQEIAWDINRSDMPIINLPGHDLSGLNFEHINLSYSNFRESNFTSTNIANANFTSANLSGADLSTKDLTENILTGADLRNANLAGADLSNNQLVNTILTGADLTDANLSGADLSTANIFGIIDGINILQKTKLKGANFTNANLTNTNLIGVDISETILKGADLTGVKLEKAKANNSNLEDLDLSFKNLSKIRLVDSNLSRTILAGADLSNAELMGANLSDVDLTGAKLIDADLTNANLTGANFHMADLTGANLEGVIINETNLSCIGHDICTS